MLTKNGYAAMAARMLSAGKLFSARLVSGTSYNLYPSDGFKPANAMKSITTNVSFDGVVLGTGNTPATLDDYKLAGTMITTFTYTGSSKSKQTDKGYECTGTYTITNTGTEAFTISEVGLQTTLHTSSNGGAGQMLIERTVLENPLTIEASGIGVLTYTIRMNYPTA